jgi:ecotin
MQAFPSSQPGQERFVIGMPPVQDPDQLKVEVIVGKTVETDGINRSFFGGRLEEENIEGWGFTRYVLKELGPMAQTRMAVDPNAPKIRQFVTIQGGDLLRYNPSLPIVVYVPTGVEVKYRFWKADSVTSSAAKS